MVQVSQGFFFFLLLDFTPFSSSISKDQSETDNLLLVFSDLLTVILTCWGPRTISWESEDDDEWEGDVG